MIDRYIEIEKIKIKVREHPSEGEIILFLHYGGGNLVMWEDVVSFFMEQYSILLLDLRGHGKSDKPAAGYHIDQMAEDVIQVLDAMQIEKTHLVGSSLGAEVGLSLAANHPERVLSLVCEGALFNESGPYGLWKGSEDEFQQHAAETLEKKRNEPEKVFDSLDALVDETRQFFEERGWWNDRFEEVVSYDAIALENGKYVKSWGRMAFEYTKNYLFYRFEDYYRRVKCPVLFMPDEIPGQDEREKEIMQGFFDLLKDGRIVYIPGWIHPFGWIVTPEKGANAVLDFLQAIRK